MDANTLLKKSMPELEKYLDHHMEQEFTVHGVTLITLIIKTKVALLSELQQAAHSATIADYQTKQLIKNLTDQGPRSES